MERQDTLRMRPHRVVAAADGALPADDTGAYHTGKHDQVLISAVYANGGGAAGFTVIPAWWDEEAQLWYLDVGQQKAVTVVGNYIWAITGYGQKMMVYVHALAGDDPSLTINVLARIADYR